MQWHFHDNPTLTVGLALAVGMIGQSAASHLRLPGIVLLLGLGVLLGPDGANLVQPDSLGTGLQSLVGIAVAVILFEGGLSLDLRRLRRAERPIRQLVTLGALTSMIVGALLAAGFLGWDWRRSLLFGTLVIVTGPTVVTPLLRRLRVKERLSTVLEGEGVLIDAVGAITAVVALEIVLRPTDETFALAAPNIAGRLLFGVVFGLVAGGALALVLRWRRVIPEGLENPFTLGWAIMTFALANAVWHESGIAAVTIAGMVVGNTRTHVDRELAEFKEQLTVMLIGLLFVLLVADVRVADVVALGWPGVLVAASSVALLRPLSAWVGTRGTELTVKERVFVGWIGPRGIVAAAVASYFAYELAEVGIEGGTELRAMVFTVIATTVLWSALTGGAAARLLDLKRPTDDGWLVLGGNAVAVEVAKALADGGATVIAVDSQPDGVRAHEDAGIRVLLGNALASSTLMRAQLSSRRGAVAVTANEEVNYLFAEKSRLAFKGLRYVVALKDHERGVTREMTDEAGAEWMFAADVDVAQWAQWLRGGEATVGWFRSDERPSPGTFDDCASRGLVPMVHRARGATEPFSDVTKLRRGSEVAVLLQTARRGEAVAYLEGAGWTLTAPLGSADDESE